MRTRTERWTMARSLVSPARSAYKYRSSKNVPDVQDHLKIKHSPRLMWELVFYGALGKLLR